MQIQKLQIRNFKGIRNLEITDIEHALILVGRNSVGKTSVLNAICAVFGQYQIAKDDFNEKKQNIEITVTMVLTEDDLTLLYKNKRVSSYRRRDVWDKEFAKRLPSYQSGVVMFSFIANYNGAIRFYDGIHKNNKYIPLLFPPIYFIDNQRNLEEIQDNLLSFFEDDLLNQMRADCCLFDRGKHCNHCFSCIGLINQKTPMELNAFEAEKLLEYKLYQTNFDKFSERLNHTFQQYGGFGGEIHYEVTCNTDRLFQVNVNMSQKGLFHRVPITQLGKGMRSIYLLSLLETYLSDDRHVPALILVEDPEIFLHPKLQKVTSEILYRLSKQSQVIFSTHSPNLLFQFHKRQIRQMALDFQGNPCIKADSTLSAILDDLGYTASDLLNVDFVFIVEGRQDKSRLPLLLEKYYSDLTDEHGNLTRISIITTNSCTNIKTYANLKYMNQIYLRDRFLMIRDSDGKDPEVLAQSLCSYYDNRGKEDIDRLPRVGPKNVLILKYYSFENYFLNPKIMVKIGVIPSEDYFFDTLFSKWQEYLHRLQSGQHLIAVLGKNLTTVADIRAHVEDIKIYVRGHNLFNIFYGRYREQEDTLLRNYLDFATREDFKDILESIDNFVYFENRKRN